MKLKTKLKLDNIQDAENVADLFKGDNGKTDLEDIGRDTFQSYEVDEQSRIRWTKKTKDATDLALQLTEEKTYPWKGAANVKFPLLTIAAMQYNARAYPGLVKTPDLVKYRVQGKDEGGVKAARGARISAHMSYQCLEQDEGWEEDHDKLMLVKPILGCAFKKSYYDPIEGHNKSVLVLPKNLCVHYYAKSIDKCERKTEIFELYDREIRERELSGIFTEHDYGTAPVAGLKDEDERQGLSPPIDDTDRPRVFLEQHRYLDLDGDGYREPYIVTIEKETKKVARIVARFDSIKTEQSMKIKDLQGRIRMLAEGVQEPTNDEELNQALRVEQTIISMQEEIKALAAETPKVLSITAVEHYTKYSFIPSPDGGFYDLGFGSLLSPLNNSVNTLLNQLIDAGTMQNANSGFLGKGARLKGGRLNMPPNTWTKVAVAGGTLRDNIVPLPVNQPSDVLFKLLGLLISYAEQLSSVTDTMKGENPGQNTPAYNMSEMLSEGKQLFNAVFKRAYRSQRGEFRKLFRLNGIYLDQEEYFSYQDSESKALKTDYTSDAKDLIPAADPDAFSSKEKAMKAQAVRESSMQVPGYDPIRVELDYLEAMEIPDRDEVYPRVPEINPETGEETGNMVLKFPPQPDPELEIKKADMQRRTLEGESRAEAQMLKTESDIMVNQAKVLLMMAQAEVAADTPEFKRLELMVKEFDDQRKALLEIAKIEQADKQAASAGLAGKSGNGSS